MTDRDGIVTSTMTGQADFPTKGEILRRRLLGWVAVWAWLALMGSSRLLAETPPSVPTAEPLIAARRELAAAPTNLLHSVALARLTFEATKSATNSGAKAKLAEEGIATARAGLRLHPQSAGLEYYLGLHLGQLASTRGMSALKLVREMETHLLTARALDPAVGDAGPDRSLGYLYLNAPGWPLSVGNNDKARHHFEQALSRAPHRPEHPLAFAEACLRWKKRDEARRHLATAEAAWTKAQELYVGPDWAGDWADWNSRLAVLREKLAEK